MHTFLICYSEKTPTVTTHYAIIEGKTMKSAFEFFSNSKVNDGLKCAIESYNNNDNFKYEIDFIVEIKTTDCNMLL